VPPALFENAFNALADLNANEVQCTGSLDDRILGHASLQCSQLFHYRRNPVSRGCKHSGPSLISCVIDLAQGRDCKDARDRLYAMLAVADDRLGIGPDYTTPLSTVLTQFVLQSLLSGDLFVLHASGIRPNHDPSLSSFVPSLVDWVGMTSRLNAPKLGFCAANMFPVSISTTAADSVLLRGVRVDAISRIYQVIPHTGLIRRKDNTLVIHLDFASWFMRGHNQPNATFGELPGFITEPLYIDTSLSKTILRILTLDALDSSKSRLLSNSVPTDLWYGDCEVKKFVDLNVASFHKNRHCFQTAQGYFGLGPSWMEPDDQVVIFDGGATPFILRNVKSEDGNPGDTWQLVGDCFLLGWMHGDYFGHTVVDELPFEPCADGEEGSSNEDKKKYLVKEWFTLI
jgi:hypothetical protein